MDSLRQIKALLAWEQLKQAEARRDQPPAFQIYDPTETELKNEYSFFLSISVQIHSMLNDGALDIPEARRQGVLKRLAKVQNEVHSLGLNQRFSRF